MEPVTGATSGNSMQFRLNDFISSHSESTRTKTDIFTKQYQDDGVNTADADLEEGSKKAARGGDVVIIQPLPSLSNENLPV
jgi:hypothetical protein